MVSRFRNPAVTFQWPFNSLALLLVIRSLDTMSLAWARSDGTEKTDLVARLPD